MRRDELRELQYITHVGNVPSICAIGLLSHHRAARREHLSIAAPNVQNLRMRKRLPGGLLLHEYVNLYITARNPMLFERIRSGLLDELCVVRVSPSVLDLEGVVITDRNAAKFGCRFKPAAEGLADVDRDLIARPYWTDGDALERERSWNAKFTEVLVPHRVSPDRLIGVLVGTDTAQSALEQDNVALDLARNSNLFFNES